MTTTSPGPGEGSGVFALPDVLETVVLGPEDRLVIVVPADLSMAERDDAARFADLFAPGRIMILAGIEQLAVLRGEPS